MDTVALSRRNRTNKKGNKENTQPSHGIKSLIKRDKLTTTPFQLKGNEKEETLAKYINVKAKAKQAGPRSTSSEASTKVKAVQRDGKGAAATDVCQRPTHNQASEQAAKHKNAAAEAPKPPAAVPALKSAPGMYKGKIVQSKIGSIWKSSSTAGVPDPKPSAPKTENQRVGNGMKSRSKSVSEMPRRGTQKPAPTRSKSAFDRPAQATKPATSSRPPARFYSARAPTRTVPATAPAISSKNAAVIPTKASGSQRSKPKVPVTDRKVNKPPVSSTLSQYRFSMETAEERRAKLSDWLASKGKTLKRPAMTTTAPSKTKASAKPEGDLKSQIEADVEVHLAEPSLDPAAPADHRADAQEAELAAPSTHPTPAIMDTSLDLLENSADLPVDPQDRVDDVVVNLCDALEAMVTPSRCTDGLTEATDVGSDVETESSKPEEDCGKEERTNETPEDVVEQQMDEVEGSDGWDEETEDVGSDDDVMEDASVIKYSVKTTPYLQSVKKTLDDEASTSTSRRKSNIKDLKFLTPVRRSCRIQRKSSCLPAMLVDHDPCVSSLAELVKLDEDPNAYIYRKNTALLEDLPDQPRL